MGLSRSRNQKLKPSGLPITSPARWARGRRRPRDFAIFYRMNALSRQLEHSFREYGIPYQMVNGVEFYQRKEIKDVLAYLHLLNNPRDGVAFLRGREYAAARHWTGDRRTVDWSCGARGIPLLEAAREAGMIEGISQARRRGRCTVCGHVRSSFAAQPEDRLKRS